MYSVAFDATPHICTSTRYSVLARSPTVAYRAVPCSLLPRVLAILSPAGSLYCCCASCCASNDAMSAPGQPTELLSAINHHPQPHIMHNQTPNTPSTTNHQLTNQPPGLTAPPSVPPQAFRRTRCQCSCIISWCASQSPPRRQRSHSPQRPRRSGPWLARSCTFLARLMHSGSPLAPRKRGGRS